MSLTVSEVGRSVYKGTTAENTAAITPISIDTAKSIVLPAIPTANPVSGGRPSLVSGPLECLVTIEGANNSRFTVNGVTPTAGIGQLLVPNGGVVSLMLRGQDVIAAFKVIGVAAGNTFTYEFFFSEFI